MAVFSSVPEESLILRSDMLKTDRVNIKICLVGK